MYDNDEEIKVELGKQGDNPSDDTPVISVDDDRDVVHDCKGGKSKLD